MAKMTKKQARLKGFRILRDISALFLHAPESKISAKDVEAVARIAKKAIRNSGGRV